MSILKRFLQGFNSYMVYRGRVKVREVLLTYSDRMLEDSGFSRELLETGVKAWPWHSVVPSLPPMNLNQNASAIHEIQGLSGDDLKNSGITSGTLRESVEFNRDSVDIHREQKVA